MNLSKTLASVFFISLLFGCANQPEKNTEDQEISYEISFENAVHHEAVIKATFTDLKPGKVSLRMSRTSPGRYALHEFAKNVYDLKVTNSKGEELKVERPDPYQWDVNEHDGTIHLSYTLFANRGGGTYSQVDETHAHLNIPATFMFARGLGDRPVKVTFNTRDDLNWKVATQLKHLEGNTYWAPNLHYFMDSPTEVSNHSVREFTESSNGKDYNIRFVLHHNGTDEELDAYFENVKKIVKQQKEVFGELPDFDFGEYTFLACYIGNASGDGMEHRNSTILTSTRSLADGGMSRNIGTVSHEFFHAWNVERIRPQALEPFDYEEANMSGELWFAEGFTSYYTGLILCRAGIITPENYVNGLAGTFNYVWNSPARRFFNPIEMSYQAPFVDAATSVDPVNRENTFISYYSYGSVLGLALDLALRNEGKDLNLDDYMKKVWNTYGKEEIPYTIDNLHSVLNEYAGQEFGDNFFNNYIHKSEMPDYKSFFENVGVSLKTDDTKAYLGASTRNGRIRRNPQIGSPAYKAGLENGDTILEVNGTTIDENTTVASLLEGMKPGDEISIKFTRHGKERQTSVSLGKDPAYTIALYEKDNIPVNDKMRSNRGAWLNKR
ncbi:PDZ domain-containing protein [Leptobacterium flavescens]|uniref:PDZ domain-containing protein n=1 Tax=Leptobacterium flavescens TaxID=472055 RepID=A0A6P0UUL2_9FLAO|nr:PDZ domain-containing protein [Leptobacterium flavescens]NER14503.1 PDZ domain-containing protein [Leptobacterium flavescens]